MTTGYLRSAKNVTGLVLAAAAPALALFGFFGVVAAVALMPLLYAVGALFGPARRDPELVSGVDPRDVERCLEQVRIRVRGRVPVDVASRVRHITTAISEALPYSQSLPAGSRARFTLAKTATDYLPSTIDAYLQLPRRYAEQETVVDGKTPAALLCEQLDLLSHEMDRLVDRIRRADTDHLVANGRFLSDRFAAVRRAPGSW